MWNCDGFLENYAEFTNITIIQIRLWWYKYNIWSSLLFLKHLYKIYFHRMEYLLSKL